jgi:CDP-diglyceride synthetase
MLTAIVAVRFYIVYAAGFGVDDAPEVSVMLGWTCIVLVIAAAAVLFFTLRYYAERPLKARKAFVFIAVFCLLSALIYVFGDGRPLEINGYNGNENTGFWLRITDVWIYLTALLLVVAFMAVAGGILWSYIKKIR